MTSNPFITGSLLITLSVVFHVAALVLLSKFLKQLNQTVCAWPQLIRKLLLLSFAVLYVIVVHTIEIVIWAGWYVHLGEFDSFIQAVYFSTVTATTLGYGDLTLSTANQMISGFEAIGGLVLFGVSTAFFIKLIGIFFDPDQSSGHFKMDDRS
ncbi:potassium channel family protein [Marinicella sediminis]|uniref:Potassium channel family protein n=1 Tax=Marinicella sediminis TaxID=1792834 RepID=A0ABV7J7W8_9GAMM|nr:potassium channel family protein [Marinicella sediminis]